MAYYRASGGFIELELLAGLLICVLIMSATLVAGVRVVRYYAGITSRVADRGAVLQVVTAACLVARPRLTCNHDGICRLAQQDGSSALIGYLPACCAVREYRKGHRIITSITTPWGIYMVADLSFSPDGMD